MASMEVLDVIHSGAVCSAWRAAYASFRTLRLPTPRQPPCLLYCARDNNNSGIVVLTLYCPSTNATLRAASSTPPTATPHLRYAVGSAHGWLFTTDDKANLFLLNPITGTGVVLPPITTLHLPFWRMTSSVGAGRYTDMTHEAGLGAGGHRQFHRATVFGSPLATASSCVVLLTHAPNQRCSRSSFYMFHAKDGLFYMLQFHS